MKMILNSSVIDFLLSKGYRYLLSKVSYLKFNDHYVNILLFPVTEVPVKQNSSFNLNTCLKITRGLGQVCAGLQGIKLLVLLNKDDISAFKHYLLEQAFPPLQV